MCVCVCCVRICVCVCVWRTMGFVEYFLPVITACSGSSSLEAATSTRSAHATQTVPICVPRAFFAEWMSASSGSVSPPSSSDPARARTFSSFATECDAAAAAGAPLPLMRKPLSVRGLALGDGDGDGDGDGEAESPSESGEAGFGGGAFFGWPPWPAIFRALSQSDGSSSVALLSSSAGRTCR